MLLSGRIPQNVNYAIKSAAALELAKSIPAVAAKLKPPGKKPLPPEDAVEAAEAATAMILVY